MTISTTFIFSSLDADPEFGELVEQFVADLPLRAAILNAAYLRDRDELRRAVHQMKGAAGSYGFPQLSHVAAALEYTLDEEQSEEQIRRELEELVDLCLRARSNPRNST